jgi:hypothetical protein
MPKQKFLIVAAPRSGSNYLCTLLNSHPDVLCHHEVFNPRGIFLALDFRNGSIDLGSPRDRDEDPWGFLDRLWKIPTSTSCVGLKITRGQAEPVLEELLYDTRIKKIVLRRRNRLKTLVSELIAEKTGQWELYCQMEKIDPPKIRVEFHQLLNHAARNKAFYDKVTWSLVSSKQPHILLEYENLRSKPEQKRTLEFLCVNFSYSHLAPASIKQTPTDLRTVISNFSELDSALAGTEYQRELHDTGH